jgi:HK97 gp10 family phage protein
MQIDVKITGKIIEKLKRGDTYVTGELQRAMNESSATIKTRMEMAAPKSEGNLLRSIRRDLFPMSASIYPTVEYAKFVESGTRPHWVPRAEWQPGGSIYRWAIKHGIPPYLVARAIARKGTRAQPFVQKTFEATKEGAEKYFDEALKRITASLGD